MIVKITEIKTNPENPRLIKDDSFKKLCKSLQDFPEMLELRPIVVDESMMVLGGNMRWKACKELGFKNVHIKIAKGLTDSQKREFVIKDNVGFGDWDWNIITNDWAEEPLDDWGLEVADWPAKIDYSILDSDDLDSQLQDMANGVKKAIQIEFELDHYEEAYALVKFWREQDAYVGKMILDFLKAEKNKL